MLYDDGKMLKSSHRKIALLDMKSRLFGEVVIEGVKHVVPNFRHPPKFLAELPIRRAIVLLAYTASCLRPYAQIRLQAGDPNPNQSILKINLLCLDSLPPEEPRNVLSQKTIQP